MNKHDPEEIGSSEIKLRNKKGIYGSVTSSLKIFENKLDGELSKLDVLNRVSDVLSSELGDGYYVLNSMKEENITLKERVDKLEVNGALAKIAIALYFIAAIILFI